ncbi:hypothetical protein [Phenylobacterium immobile]|uniref:hypothetical protein n=1 Tax=Phenylobacterium immobile TaxID=21 RepID=UPI000A4679BA|nr:hypothetical protein [Phenylobacterium immobile]
MQDTASLAYSLSQQETGWRWSIYDADGVTIADGANPSQADAQAEVYRRLQRGGADDR